MPSHTIRNVKKRREMSAKIAKPAPKGVPGAAPPELQKDTSGVSRSGQMPSNLNTAVHEPPSRGGDARAHSPQPSRGTEHHASHNIPPMGQKVEDERTHMGRLAELARRMKGS